MGSPKPPQVMPQSINTKAAVAASSFSRLPLDIKYIVLQKLDSFATLNALEMALGAEAEDIFGLFHRGINSAVAQTEFAPVADAVMAIRMLDLAASPTTLDTVTNKTFTTPRLVEGLTAPINTGSGLLDAPELYNKLYVLNIAAIGLAELYSANKGVILSDVEFFRFKQAVFRCATLFELYKEAKASKFATSQGDNGEDEDEEEEQDDDIEDDEGKEKTKYRPRNTFLASIPHQEVLEMDCVREFMHELAEEIAKIIEEDDDDEEKEEERAFGQDQLASVLNEFGFGMSTIAKASCTCTSRNDTNNESNDHNDGTNDNDNNTSCTLQTPHLADSLLLLGPIALLRLLTVSQAKPQQTKLLKAIIHILIPTPNRKSDIFWDEVMPFWKGLRGVYDLKNNENVEIKKAKMEKMPRGCVSIMDVMSIKKYEYAVLDSGRLFY